MVDVNDTLPSLVVLLVVMVTFAPKVTGPVKVTVLVVASDVVIEPLRVMDVEPVMAIVFMPLATDVPIAPTATVLVVPPVELNVTSSEELPLIASIVIAPPAAVTVRSEPFANKMLAVLKDILSSEEVNVVKAAPLTKKLFPLAAV